VETTHYVPGLAAAATYFASAADHKQKMFDFARAATFIALVRDRGHGSVTIDAQGQAIHAYDLTDAVDLQTIREGVAATVGLHAAGGATEIAAIAQGLPMWRAGEALEPFIANLQAMRFGFGGVSLFSAHQMGTCRMGTDPRTSVAGPFGQLHDVPGVYVGDGSAFPTASGTNPMISIMALARRTAMAIADE
jgi:choline dehydrogenase-like flavoprotein